jgi:hypothetical protein
MLMHKIIDNLVMEHHYTRSCKTFVVFYKTKAWFGIHLEKNDITFPWIRAFWLGSRLEEPVMQEHFSWHEKVTFTCQDNQELKIFSHAKIFFILLPQLKN